MRNTTDTDWAKWGAQNPFFGVISNVRFSKENIQNSRADFYQSGEEQCAMFLAQAEDAIGKVNHDRALDFGCGTGRLALPLARRFSHVTAMDIADGMIDEARAEAARANILNVEFVKSDDELKKATGSYDLVHTYIVLQHIPTVRGMAIISRLLDLVAINGVAMIQVVVQRPRHIRHRLRYFLQHAVPGVRQLYILVSGKRMNAPTMQMNEYGTAEILRLFAAKNFGAILTYPEMNTGILSVRYVARKAKGPYMAQFESPDFGEGQRYMLSNQVRMVLS